MVRRPAVFALPMLLAGSLVLLAACRGTPEYPLVGSARVEGAEGTVQLEKLEGDSRLVTITLSHLPPPERLGPELTAYVVWFVPSNATPTRAGRLAYDASTREGSLMATTTLRAFTLKITAERDAEADEPSEIVIAQRNLENP